MPRGSVRRARLALAGLIGVLALIGILFVPTSADAAGLGPGYAPAAQPLNHLGGYLAADGRVAYCIEAGLPSALGGTTTDGGLVSQVNGLSEASMIALNYVLSQHGNTADNNTAAAVAMAVWSIANNGPYQAEGGDAAIIRRAPESQRPAIQSLADQFRAEAVAYRTPVAQAAMSLSIDPASDYEGFLDVMVDPAMSTATVTLSNGVFVDSGKTFAENVGDGAHLAVRATPSGSADLPYRISARADNFSAPGSISSRVQLYSTPGSQTLAASAPSEPVLFSASALDPRDRLVVQLTTVAQPTATVGGTIVDTATVSQVPSTGIQLEFAAYLQLPGTVAPDCSAATLVFRSHEPFLVNTEGSYASETFTATDDQVGMLLWIATAKIAGQVVARGICGDPAEKTIISPLVVDEVADVEDAAEVEDVAPKEQQAAPPTIRLPIVSA